MTAPTGGFGLVSPTPCAANDSARRMYSLSFTEKTYLPGPLPARAVENMAKSWENNASGLSITVHSKKL